MQGVLGWKAAPRQRQSARCGGERGTASVPVPITASFTSLQVFAWAEATPKHASVTTARREGWEGLFVRKALLRWGERTEHPP